MNRPFRRMNRPLRRHEGLDNHWMIVLLKGQPSPQSQRKFQARRHQRSSKKLPAGAALKVRSYITRLDQLQFRSIHTDLHNLCTMSDAMPLWILKVIWGLCRPLTAVILNALSPAVNFSLGATATVLVTLVIFGPVNVAASLTKGLMRFSCHICRRLFMEIPSWFVLPSRTTLHANTRQGIHRVCWDMASPGAGGEVDRLLLPSVSLLAPPPPRDRSRVPERQMLRSASSAQRSCSPIRPRISVQRH